MLLLCHVTGGAVHVRKVFNVLRKRLCERLLYHICHNQKRVSFFHLVLLVFQLINSTKDVFFFNVVFCFFVDALQTGSMWADVIEIPNECTGSGRWFRI